MMLRPPVEPMLAQAREGIPAPGALPGGLALEPKFDGYRALLFTPSEPGGPVLLQTRRGSLIQQHFPDLVAAAAQLPQDLVLDGEVVVWHEERLSFEALQRRAASGARTAEALARSMPAHFIAFDALQKDGQELVREPYARRRAVLESLFTEHSLGPPWTLCPMTTDPAAAQQWLEEWTEVRGIEGVMIKGLGQRYAGGSRGWFKVKRRTTAEAVVGAVTGSLARPQVLLLGRFDDHGRLRPVGRTTPLRPAAAAELSALLRPGGPGHAWEGVRFSAAWGSPRALEALTVVPDVVAEFHADTAFERGAWRHPVRFARVRLDTTVDDVPLFGAGQDPAEG
ncbi:ATP-dependent DNA ligase [Streptomyces sp. NPDC059835]|uniref:ATP-dependent DNA ligase n=1 Tax=Streptomyces sp. NPDC059835 TaxID=3346967 RepID=UPI00365A39AB